LKNLKNLKNHKSLKNLKNHKSLKNLKNHKSLKNLKNLKILLNQSNLSILKILDKDQPQQVDKLLDKQVDKQVDKLLDKQVDKLLDNQVKNQMSQSDLILYQPHKTKNQLKKLHMLRWLLNFYDNHVNIKNTNCQLSKKLLLNLVVLSLC